MNSQEKIIEEQMKDMQRIILYLVQNNNNKVEIPLSQLFQVENLILQINVDNSNGLLTLEIK